MPLNLAQLEALIDEKILSGGRRTLASNLREVLKEISETADAGGTVAIIDPVPTDGSANAVSSNGVFDALTLKASISYVDGLMLGLWDDRGNFDASVNVFPSSGGSGTAGAVLKGDIWTVSVAGTLGGSVVEAGDTVRALSDAPGQTAGNWAIAQNNIGYVPLNKSGDTMLGNLDMGGNNIVGSDLYLLVDGAYTKAWEELTQTYAAVGFGGGAQVLVDGSGISLSVTGLSRDITITSNNGNVDISAVDAVNIAAIEAYFSGSSYAELFSSDTVGIQAPNAINIGSDGSAVINIGSATTTNAAMTAGDSDELSISYVAITNAGFQYSNSYTGFNAGVVGNSNGVGILADDSDFYAYLSTANLGSDLTYLFPATGGTFALINNETFTGSTTFGEVFITDTTSKSALKVLTTTRLRIGNDFDILDLVAGGGTAKLILAATTITAHADTDSTNIFGRSRLDSRTSDFAFFSHFDRTSSSEYALRQGTAGHTTVNSVTGQTVRIAIQNSNVATFGTAGIDFTSPFTVSSDTDATTILGRARIHSPVADSLFLSHFDFSTNVNYALFQGSAGQTALNSATGQNLTLRVNNSILVTLSSTLLTLAVPAKFPSYTVAGAPSAATMGAGSMIYISNEVGGAVMAFSDGTNWLRVTDRAAISV